MATKIIMPELGEGVIEGSVSRWLKQEGDKVAQYEPVLEIETDKVTTEATAEVAGTLLKIEVPEGQTVPVGTVLAYIGKPGEALNGGEATETAPVKEAVKEPAPAKMAPPAKVAAPAETGRAKTGNGNGRDHGREKSSYSGRISPVVGRIAEEHDVDLSQVEGTGLGGRITKKDILAYVGARDTAPAPVVTAPPEQRAPALAAAQPEPGRPAPAAPPDLVPGETVPLTSMRRAIAEHMVRSKHTSPHVTTVFDVDFRAVAQHRASHKDAFARDNANLTFTAYLITAVVQALKLHPLVNSSWSDNGVILKREINVGMAAAIPEGLIVPVIKNADSFSLLGLARTINDLTHRARNKQLRPDEVQGGTFTLTNHGTSGSLFATPIINQPQCGILGVGKIEKRVKVIQDAIAIRPMAYVSLTFDHRILDGASADAFVSTVKDLIENWR
jgi:pyruvate/2-oxoglutarate dehydrogenase complex dihydrolipoamide acyltransferase (E2) component